MDDKAGISAKGGQAERWLPLFVVLVSAGYLYLNLFARPRTPFLLGGDQVYFWLDALRMFDGGRVYEDFLQFTPPGTDLLFLGLFKLFGLHIWLTNAVVLLLGTAFAWICFSLARQIMRPRVALLASSVFVVVIYSRALNATHHWFGVLAVLCAVRVGIRAVTPARLLFAGALLGLASFLSFFHGAAAVLAFAAFLFWKYAGGGNSRLKFVRGLASVFAGYIAALLLLNSPLIASVGLKQLFYFQVTYARRYVAPLQQGEPLGLPLPLTLRNLPALSQYFVVYLSLPVACIVALRWCWRQRSVPARTQPIVLLSAVASALLLEIAFSPNWLRLYAVSAPAVILAVWALDRLPRVCRYASTLLWIGIFAHGTHQIVSRHKSQRIIVDLPAGRAAVAPQTADKLGTIMLRTRPGDYVLQAGWPGIYLPLLVRNPLYFDTVGVVDAPRPEDIELVLRQLKEKRVPLVLWTAALDMHCPPATFCDDRLTPVRGYLAGSYTLVQRFPDGDALWQRRDQALHP